jgi:hypothetical protein
LAAIVAVGLLAGTLELAPVPFEAKLQAGPQLREAQRGAAHREVVVQRPGDEFAATREVDAETADVVLVVEVAARVSDELSCGTERISRPRGTCARQVERSSPTSGSRFSKVLRVKDCGFRSPLVRLTSGR